MILEECFVPLPEVTLQALRADEPASIILPPPVEAVDAFFLWQDLEGTVQLRTLLQLASYFGAVETVRALLNVPASAAGVNTASPTDGLTALHGACSRPNRGLSRVIALLIGAGADKHALDALGRTPTALLTAAASPASVQDDEVAATSELARDCYRTDKFRMFQFKIETCPRLEEMHSWTLCPYMHPGEKARRRDPRLYRYQGVPCPDYRKGLCKRGDLCPFSHGVFESWLHPSKYRTQLCQEGQACRRTICFFAHSVPELREPTHCFDAVEEAAAAALRRPRARAGSKAKGEAEEGEPAAASSPPPEASASAFAEAALDTPERRPSRTRAASSAQAPASRASALLPPPPSASAFAAGASGLWPEHPSPWSEAPRAARGSSLPHPGRTPLPPASLLLQGASSLPPSPLTPFAPSLRRAPATLSPSPAGSASLADSLADSFAGSTLGSLPLGSAGSTPALASPGCVLPLAAPAAKARARGGRGARERLFRTHSASSPDSLAPPDPWGQLALSLAGAAPLGPMVSSAALAAASLGGPDPGLWAAQRVGSGVDPTILERLLLLQLQAEAAPTAPHTHRDPLLWRALSLDARPEEQGWGRPERQGRGGEFCPLVALQ